MFSRLRIDVIELIEDGAIAGRNAAAPGKREMLDERTHRELKMPQGNFWSIPYF